MHKRKIMRKVRKLERIVAQGRGSDSTELLEKVAKCGDCAVKLAEQAQAIEDLRRKNAQQATQMAMFTTQIVELTRKLEAMAKPPQEARPAAKPVVATPAKKPDNLELIEGIGPKIAEVLAKEGIASFAQLAAMDKARLEAILVKANIHAPSDPTTWPKQARLAADGKMDELRALQAQLVGGRTPGSAS